MGHSSGFILVFIFLLVSLLAAGHFYVSGFIDWLQSVVSVRLLVSLLISYLVS